MKYWTYYMKQTSLNSWQKVLESNLCDSDDATL